MDKNPSTVTVKTPSPNFTDEQYLAAHRTAGL
jgi:hypothetical protein